MNKKLLYCVVSCDCFHNWFWFQVEKQKILQVSTGKSVHRTDGCNNRDQSIIGKGDSGAKSAKTIGENAGAGAKNVENVKNMSNTRHGNPTTSTVSSSLVSSRSATTGAKQKSTADIRKPPSGFNFFERWSFWLCSFNFHL